MMDALSKRETRPRGSGCLFLRGTIYYGKFYTDGQPHIESLNTADPGQAERKLQRLIRASQRGEYLSASDRKTTVKELFDALLADYRMRGKRSLGMVESKWKRLGKFFNCRASAITTDMLTRYILQCQKDGLEAATINRDMSALKRAFNLGYRCTPRKVAVVPVFPTRLSESAPRQGFVDQQQFDTLYKHAGPLWMKALITTAYTFGFRRGELLNMKVKQLDFANRTIELYRGTTKSGEPRLVRMTEDVYQLLRALCMDSRPDDRVFTREDGKPIVDTRDAWATMCGKAGLGHFECPSCNREIGKPETKRWACPHCGKEHGKHAARYVGLIMHDLRRSAVRNMIRRGIPQRVAMEISGHRTASVFSRYNIVDMTDLTRAADQIEAGRKLEQANGVPDKFGTQNGVQIAQMTVGNA